MALVGFPMSAAPTKAQLFQWVDDQTQLDAPVKYLLEKLASYAGADNCAWAKIDTLAKHINRSDRQVQNYLKILKESGLIKDTGRKYRLKDSTRSVPWYELLVADKSEPEVVCEPEVWVKHASPIDGVWVKPEASMGEAHFTCIEPIEPKGANAPSASAREGLKIIFSELEAAMPPRMFAFGDRDAAIEAFIALADQGVEVGELPGCMRRMAVDPVFVSRKFPQGLDGWLIQHRFRAWWPGTEASASSAAATSASKGPPRFPDGPVRTGFVAAKGETFVASYLDAAGWDAGQRLIAPRTVTARDRLREVRDVLRSVGVSIGDVEKLGQLEGSK